ncbi:ATP-binding protein [Lacticaseibacillus chiayiensis]|uniref:ATP-binding protein n=1 Tax=Lacticaseibacillus chiayiensis TaxID=2100821 RepID=UPI001304C8FA|nr:ATP-binding protein [Lacticaseibacillus chiayiensis]
MKKIDFNETTIIGEVDSVNAGRVIVSLQDSLSSTDIHSAKIGELIAIATSDHSVYTIGSVTDVRRSFAQNSEDVLPEEDSITNMLTVVNLLESVFIGTLLTIRGTSVNKFKRGIEDFPSPGDKVYSFDSENLTLFMNSISELSEAISPLTLGKYAIDKQSIANLNGDKFFQKHAAILGSTGSGKSWLVSKLLEEASNLNYSNIIVFDIHGEYHTLTKNEGGFAKYLKIAGPSDTKLRDDILYLPFWTLNREELQYIVLDRSDHEAPNQANRFNQHILEQKKTTVAENGDFIEITGDSPVPFRMSTLLTALKEDDEGKGVSPKTGKPIKGVWNGRLTRFIARLESKTQDRRYAFMFNPPEETYSYDWLQNLYQLLLSTTKGGPGIKVIDFSAVPSDVLPIVTGVVGRLIFDLQSWIHAENRTPVALVCDEAHLYLPTRDLMTAIESQPVRNFERIAKEGRKYGLSLVVVSQRPADFNRTILSQCNNFIVLRLTNGTDQSSVRTMLPDSMSQFLNQLPVLDTGEAIAVGDAVIMPTRIVLDKPKFEPDSNTKRFWNDWDQRPFDLGILKQAIVNMRAQTYLNHSNNKE